MQVSQLKTLTTQPSSSARAEHSLSQEIPHLAPYLLGGGRHRGERVRGSSATGTRGGAWGTGRGAGNWEGYTTGRVAKNKEEGENIGMREH